MQWCISTRATSNYELIVSSTGLFHKAISQSGTNLAAWARPAHPGVAAERAVKLGKKLGCTSDPDKLVDCLRTVDATTITSAFYDFFVSTLIYPSKMLARTLNAAYSHIARMHVCTPLGMGHRSDGTLSTSRRTRFAGRLYHRPSQGRCTATRTVHTLADRSHDWRGCHEIGTYVLLSTHYATTQYRTLRDSYT